MSAARFKRFSVEMPESAVMDCAGEGYSGVSLEYWHERISLAHIDDYELRQELRERKTCGEAELQDRAGNEKRLLRIAALLVLEQRKHERLEARRKREQEKLEAHRVWKQRWSCRLAAFLGLCKEHFSGVVVALGLVLAVTIHGCANRYVPTSGGKVLDRWTGKHVSSQTEGTYTYPRR